MNFNFVTLATGILDGMVLLVDSTLPVFLGVLCDNLLLTVVVPILPELLREQVSNSTLPLGTATEDPSVLQRCLKELLHLQMLKENSQLGLLFSTKAIVQLICNPLVGTLTFRIGYKLPLCIGNFILFLCSLVFGLGDSYVLYLMGRSFHGLASSLVAISGMALVAELYPGDQERTRVLGRVMGAAALGVLIGYPFGGLTFALFGKTVPFVFICILALINTGLQASGLNTVHLNEDKTKKTKAQNVLNSPKSTWCLLKDRSILIISIAVCLSTMAMAILEPTLPIWLIDNLDPPKWQMGLVFVPDSLGYFVGTNYFGELSLQLGRWKMSMISMAVIGTACFMLPLSQMVWQLAFPHFALGLGLGVVDASLMPLLARRADDKHEAGYGAVYALAQTSVALAYSFGPLVGGELVPLIGFPDLIRSIGFLNLFFCPFLFLLSDVAGGSRQPKPTEVGERSGLTMSQFSPREPDSEYETPYQRFHDHLDSD